MDVNLVPVFVLGMQRGGTNLVLNLLRSHPDCCWPDGELHEVIRGRRSDGLLGVFRKVIWYLPVAARHGDVFHPMRVPPSGMLAGLRGRLIRQAIDGSVRTNRPKVRGFQQQLPDGDAAVSGQGRRMVCKVVNGNTALAWDLERLYDGAHFLGIVRHPFAVCEGLMRRGASLKLAIQIYNAFVATLMELESEGRSIVILRYEDVITDPQSAARQAYSHCSLDEERVEWVCLEEKSPGPDGAVSKVNRYYRLSEIGDHMRAGLNEAQAERLSDNDCELIASECRVALERFGYDEGNRSQRRE
jgi:hypothetical protein